MARSIKKKSSTVNKLTGTIRKWFGSAKESSSSKKKSVPLAQLSPRTTSISTRQQPAAGSPGPPDCGVKIQSVNLCGNKIVTKLTGPSSNNDLFKLQVFNSADPSTLVVILNATRTPGTYTDAFDISGLTAGVAYDTVEAVYVCGGVNNVDDFSYNFKILGNYRHSQYNTPHESDPTCQSGGTNSVCLTDNSCNYTTGSLFGTFNSQTWLNGSGYSINYGLIKPEAYCPSHGFPPPSACNGIHIYRKNQTLTPACSGLGLNNSTVARRASNPDLTCGNKVCIVGAGSGGSNLLKTVTDLCPGCTLTQLDNYTTNGACTGIPDLGNFKTVKVP
jgi:hypothetical protein